VLCTGGIEVPRLLLACRSQRSCGLGNENDLVGRFLQDHPAANLGTVVEEVPETIQKLFNGIRKRGRKYSVRLSLSPKAQAQSQLLNASAGFLFRSAEDRGFGCVRAFVQHTNESGRPSFAKAFVQGMFALPSITKAAKRLFIGGRIFTPGASCDIAGSFEQEPNPSSRVSLSDKTDALGMPLSKIDWRLTDKTLNTARHFASLIDSEFRRLEIGKLIPADWLRDAKNANEQGVFHDQNHHMGTTRMSAAPSEGVVDTNLAVFNVPNLYIASSSVFPTSGHSNPTLTILALGLRLSDHLKATLREERRFSL
jgi:choline dehydrogenase-like flavoprotein